MLMHHSDSQIISIIRIVNGNFLPVFVNLALLRLIKTKEYAH